MTLESAIQQSTEGRPVLVEFYADWCPHCRRMRPVVDQVRDVLGDMATIYQFDSDAQEEDARQANVESLPTFIVYKDGKEVWRHSGEITGGDLLSHVESYT